jgi:hypothetical protein
VGSVATGRFECFKLFPRGERVGATVAKIKTLTQRVRRKTEDTEKAARFDEAELAATDSKAKANSTAKSTAPASKEKAGGRYKVNGNRNGKIESNVKIESNITTDGDCCPVPLRGTGRYKVRGKSTATSTAKTWLKVRATKTC